MGSIYELNEKQKDKYNTRNNCFHDFPVGVKVKVICVGQDFNFFYEETGKVTSNSNRYLGISVTFDKPRKFKDGTIQRSFGFNPEDLIKLKED